MTETIFLCRIEEVVKDPLTIPPRPSTGITGMTQDNRTKAQRRSDEIMGETASYAVIFILGAAFAVTAVFHLILEMPAIGDLCGLGIVVGGIGCLIVRLNALVRRQGRRWLW